MLRLTAKDTLFGQPNFSSWLIEASGALPMKRQKDHVGETIDNSKVMDILMKALEDGDMICLFPEGLSRYHPQIAPLKTGVARIASDALSRNRDNPDFEITILTCSLTYMHREHFRSDVLVTFNPPITLTVKDHPHLLAPASQESIKALTTTLQAQISLGTIDAPSWEIIGTAKTAARIYAPFGTGMKLGDWVRVLRTFVDLFTSVGQYEPELISELSTEALGNNWEAGGHFTPDGSDEDVKEAEGRMCKDELRNLMYRLQEYQDKLNRMGIKDDRIRKPLTRNLIIYRLLIRLVWGLTLFTLSLPGLVLSAPVFVTINRAVKKVKASGRAQDTWDEISQTKLVYGLAGGLGVWIFTVLLSILLPFADFSAGPLPLPLPLGIRVSLGPLTTAVLVPCIMWLTLRWMEDAISDGRACLALWKILWISSGRWNSLLDERRQLELDVKRVAKDIGLPEDPEAWFMRGLGKENSEGDRRWSLRKGKEVRGQVKGKWDSGARYFSLRRRRKRDWNEVLRLYDKVDYPDAS